MKEIESIETLKAFLEENRSLSGIAFQGLDLTDFEDVLLKKHISDSLFLGCKLSNKVYFSLVESDNQVFPSFNYSFKIFRNKLYTTQEMYENFDAKNPSSYRQTLDYKINEYYQKTGGHNPINIQESLARRMHDHAITNALNDVIKRWEASKIVAVMGGHLLQRNAKEYATVALLAKQLAKLGYMLITGGGPGAMEATHLGAWFAHRKNDELNEAIGLLSTAPTYKDSKWLSAAFEVMEKYTLAENIESIGIPTWYYGHEPPTPFATKIAKYFANSVREEGLLTIAKGGVIFTPGSIGTIQEVFQEAAQNHYASGNGISPMVFLGKKYWKKIKPVYPVLKILAKEENYFRAVSIHSKPEEVVEAIVSFPKTLHP